jgi:uncharacterized protein involved in exopolysaccharide biosynthesis
VYSRVESAMNSSQALEAIKAKRMRIANELAELESKVGPTHDCVVHDTGPDLSILGDI